MSYTVQTAKSGKIYARVSDAVYATLAAYDAHYVTGEAIIILAYRQGTQEEYGRIDPINERSSRFQRSGRKARRIDARGSLSVLRPDAMPID